MAQPMPCTLVVNIGDYMMRLTNVRFRSTVHRVFDRTIVDRISMPFFFECNFNEKCGVLLTCVDNSNRPSISYLLCRGMFCSSQ